MAYTQEKSFLSVPYDEEFEMGCSDEEMAEMGSDWEPEPEEIVELFEAIAKNKVLELEWKRPDERPLTPENNIGIEEFACNEKIEVAVAKTAFDFEEKTTPITIDLRPMGTDIGLRGSGKRKITTFEDILSNMASHRDLYKIQDDEIDSIRPIV